jgi:altronate hydrolase
MGIVRPRRPRRDPQLHRHPLVGELLGDRIARIADCSHEERLAAYPNVDGVVAFTHNTGCGMSTPSLNFDVFRRTLAGYARHPNLAAVLIVGLGCERNQIADLLASQGLEKGPKLVAFNMQETGGTRESIAAGVAAIEKLLPEANDVTRVPVSARHLSIGLQCGGSDGFSSISANPALGAAMDILVRHGGTAILSETPEIYGVENMLTRRAVSPEVGQKLLDRSSGGRNIRAARAAR